MMPPCFGVEAAGGPHSSGGVRKEGYTREEMQEKRFVCISRLGEEEEKEERGRRVAERERKTVLYVWGVGKERHGRDGTCLWEFLFSWLEERNIECTDRGCYVVSQTNPLKDDEYNLDLSSVARVKDMSEDHEEEEEEGKAERKWEVSVNAERGTR